MSVPEELFDVVDASDAVIGQLPRSEVHARGLLHRAVSIFVLNGRGELLIHRRSAAKDEYPLLFTSSASGHVSAGESYDETAPRELREELGLTASLRLLAKFPASADTANEHTAFYEAVTDDVPVPDPGEIAEVEWCDVEALAQRIERRPEEFTPPFRLLFQWRFENRRARQA
ncbi:MAG: NUDIX domain-containing protein [Planctomycetota bacterium]|nr:NUDIX domain-containing protein [Planctomycetaceae bacterium]MDQ3329770.1 NUDIX domain-containing protein [Planctomycetota bacterium]